MSVSVAVSDIKERLGISGTAEDAVIGQLINQLQPVIEAEIRPDLLGAGVDSRIGAAINYAAADLIAGEYAARAYRELGILDGVEVEGLVLRPYVPEDLNDPTGLRAAGQNRLKPYLRVDIAVPAEAPAYGDGGRA